MPLVATWELRFAYLQTSVPKTMADRSRTSRIDAQDIADSLNGRQDAFERLVKRHQNTVSKWMWRFTRNRTVVEELVQEVFVQAWTSLSRFKGESEFRTWLFTIANRTGYAFWKKKAKEQAIAKEAAEYFQLQRQADMAPSEAAQVLYDLLAELPPRDRLVLTLVYFEDMDTKTIARITGWSRTMVKVQAHRARTKLKKILERAGFGQPD